MTSNVFTFLIVVSKKKTSIAIRYLKMMLDTLNYKNIKQMVLEQKFTKLIYGLSTK